MVVDLEVGKRKQRERGRETAECVCCPMAVELPSLMLLGSKAK